MKNTRSINLKKQWEIYKSRTKLTQPNVSAVLGWSSSFFGKLVNGNSDINDEHLIKIANLFDIPPTLIDPNFEQQVRGLFEIYRTTSGEPPPKAVKLFRPQSKGRKIIWNDIMIHVEAGEGVRFPLKQGNKQIVGSFAPDTTLVCQDPMLSLDGDPAFPPTTPPVFLILHGDGKISARCQQKIPRVKGAEILRVITVIFV